MSAGDAKQLHCTECGARGAGQDGLCKPCRIGQEHGPKARRRYFQNIARKGGEAAQAKRGRHRLDVGSLPSLTDHGSAKAWLAALAEDVASGQLSESLAAETRKVLKTFMAAHRAEVTDEVVSEIREELKELRGRLQVKERPWE